MKNLKKLISVIIAVIMIVGSFATVSAADYKDVESTNSFYKAITVLSGLGIVNGDTEGNFNPENDIKRSEMVALVCRAMGEEDIATASASNAFTDVAANHWAAGYIAWGVNRGIINGMGDGTFAPDASVSYQDAVVMIMRALGYEGIAQRKEHGGYPVGYLKLASQNGVLKEAGYDNQAAAPRKIVAQLIYNALTAPLVDFSSFGYDESDDKYTIYDGNRANLQTLLTYTNSIYKFKATVTDTSKINLDLLGNNGEAKVELTLATKAFYNYESTLNDPVSVIKAELGVDEYGKLKAFVGETEAADLLGATVEAYAYIDEETDEPVLLAVVADTKATIEKTIEGSAIDSISIDGATLKYIADETATRETELDLGTVTYYFNGKKVAAGDWTTINSTFIDPVADYDDVTPGVQADNPETDDVEEFLRAADKIVLTGNKTAAKYDTIYVTQYKYERVASVNTEDKTIYYASAGALELDAEIRGITAVEEFNYNLYDANGVAIALDDIAEDDILNMVIPAYDLDENYTDLPFIDIYVTNDTITGKATEQRNGKWIFDGEAYEDLASISSNFEGTFYLSIDGKIVDKEGAKNISKDFAFILSIGEREDIYDSVGKAYTIKLFTADGEVVSLDVADKIKYNGATKKVEDGSQASSIGALKTTFDASDVSGPDAIVTFQGQIADRIITYKLDDAGKISDIVVPNYDVLTKSTAAYAYNDEYSEFGGVAIGENAPLFIIPVPTEIASANVDSDGDGTADKFRVVVDTDKLSIATFDSLDPDKAGDYASTIYKFDIDDEETIGAAVMEKSAYGTDFKGTSLAVVTEVGTTYNEDDDEIQVVSFIQSGETLSLKVVMEDAPTLAKGDAFNYNVDANGDIIDLEKIFDATTLTLNTSVTDGYVAATNKVGYIYGFVTSYKNGTIILADDIKPAEGVGYEPEAAANSIRAKFSAGEGFTYVMYDKTGVNPVVKKSALSAIKATTRLTDAYLVVAKVDKDEKIEDVIIIRTKQFADTDAVDTFGSNFDVEA